MALSERLGRGSGGGGGAFGTCAAAPTGLTASGDVVCGLTCDRARYFVAHKSCHNPKDIKTGLLRTYKCEMCEWYFRTQKSYLEHKKNVHYDYSPSNEEIHASPAPVRPKGRPRPRPPPGRSRSRGNPYPWWSRAAQNRKSRSSHKRIQRLVIICNKMYRPRIFKMKLQIFIY